MENKQIQGLDVNGTKPTVAVPNSINDLNDGNTVLTKSSSSNKVYATDNSGNQTTLSYSQGINDGASIVQRDASGRITAQDPASNTDVANKLYVDTVFDGSQKALAYADYNTMITAFNDFSESAYKVGQNVYIRTLNVPDLWVYSVESTSVPYTYVDDATFIAGLTTDGYVQVGYYRLSQLETQTASISNVKAGDIDSESATSGQVLTANGSGGASWQSPSGSHLYLHRIKYSTRFLVCDIISTSSTVMDVSAFIQYLVSIGATIGNYLKTSIRFDYSSGNVFHDFYTDNNKVYCCKDILAINFDSGTQTATLAISNDSERVISITDTVTQIS